MHALLTTVILPWCHQPQNVKVLRDVMANGYRAGGNAKFFDKDGDLQKAKKAIMERLAFEDGDGSEYPASLLAFPMKRAQYEGTCQTVMSLTSRLLPWEVQSADHKSFPGGEVAFKAYNSVLSLNQVHFGEFCRKCPALLHAHAPPPLTHSSALRVCFCRRGPPGFREPGLHLTGTVQNIKHWMTRATSDNNPTF